jgi:hypothetical protein
MVYFESDGSWVAEAKKRSDGQKPCVWSYEEYQTILRFFDKPRRSLPTTDQIFRALHKGVPNCTKSINQVNVKRADLVRRASLARSGVVDILSSKTQWFLDQEGLKNSCAPKLKRKYRIKNRGYKYPSKPKSKR